jgi:hypothetical protein
LKVFLFKSVLSVNALMVFKDIQKLFTIRYTIINFLFASLKSPTNFENAS